MRKEKVINSVSARVLALSNRTSGPQVNDTDRRDSTRP